MVVRQIQILPFPNNAFGHWVHYNLSQQLGHSLDHRRDFSIRLENKTQLAEACNEIAAELKSVIYVKPVGILPHCSQD